MTMAAAPAGPHAVAMTKTMTAPRAAGAAKAAGSAIPEATPKRPRGVGSGRIMKAAVGTAIRRAIPAHRVRAGMNAVPAARPAAATTRTMMIAALPAAGVAMAAGSGIPEAIAKRPPKAGGGAHTTGA